MDRCIACAAGFHYECFGPVSNDDGLVCCCPDTNVVETVGAKRGGPVKLGEDMEDVTSTGRKRAAKLFPIPDASKGEAPIPCEWKGLKNAGGGVQPIIGCLNGTATDRHHGPDKSTLNNNESNVHRICSTCHNRWHTRNDPHYGKRPDSGAPFIPVGDVTCLTHDAVTLATQQDIFNSEMYWKSNKLTRRES